MSNNTLDINITVTTGTPQLDENEAARSGEVSISGANKKGSRRHTEAGQT
jgi:hypothetical protein